MEGLLKICSQSKNNLEAFLTKFRSIPKILGARAIASVLDFRGLAKRSVASFLDVNIFQAAPHIQPVPKGKDPP